MLPSGTQHPAQVIVCVCVVSRAPFRRRLHMYQALRQAIIGSRFRLATSSRDRTSAAMASRTHFDLGAPDPAKIMEYLSSLPPDQAQQIMAEATGKLQQQFVPKSKSERVIEFRQRRELLLKDARSGMHQMTMSHSHDHKPQGGAASWAALTPMLVQDLQVGTTHRGRVLEGQVIADPALISSVMLLLEDRAGGILEVAIYNIPGMSWELADRMFPRGRWLSIREPYFKVSAAGSLIVRIDDPADLRETPKLAGKLTAQEWREQGNSHFKQRQWQDAARSYEAAWQLIAEGRASLALVFSNRAQCHLRLQQSMLALRDAGVALQLDPDNRKAAARLATARKEVPECRGRAWPRVCEILTWGMLPQASPEEGSWETAKAEGNELYREGELERAVTLYSQSIGSHPALADLVPLAGNLAAVCLKTEAFDSSLLHASMAIALKPVFEKGWLWRARALDGLGDPSAAAASLGGLPFGWVAPEAERLEVKARVAPVSDIPTEQQREHRDGLHDRLREQSGLANADELSMASFMIDALPAHAKAEMRAKIGPHFARKPPPFHTEFPKAHGWPYDSPSDTQRCQALLYDEYSTGLAQPWMMELAMREDGFALSERDLLHRFHSPQCMAWVAQHAAALKPGSILRYKEDASSVAYTPFTRTNFGNVPVQEHKFEEGTTHVAVGFNDLGLLLTCSLHPGESGGSGPFKFVGVDSSAFVAAKCMVLADMVGTASVSAGDCLQAWFSSCWTAAAAKAFQQSAGRVVASCSDVAVRSYLLHWQSSQPPSLHAARQQWLASRGEARGTKIPSWRDHGDRMALCRYCLTGELIPGGEPASVGSLAMYSVPSGSPPNAGDEVALHSVLIGDLAGQKMRSGADVVRCLMDLLMERIERLRRWVAEDKVAIQCVCAEVGPDTLIVEWIADLKPATMSWSNVLDYMKPAAFHSIARACSAGRGTVHSGYSMNWIAEVYGTCISDYTDKKERNRILDESHRALERSYSESGADKVMVCPPFENPRNFTSWLLCSRHQKAWVDYFFAAKGAGPTRLGKVNMLPYSPVSYNATPIHLSWAYKV